MSAGTSARSVRRLDWIEPLAVAAGLADRGGLICLLSDGGDASRSYVAIEPTEVRIDSDGVSTPFKALRDLGIDRQLVGLASYDAGARVATGRRERMWPDLMLAHYPAMLVFDHAARTLDAVGLGPDVASAEAASKRAADWSRRARSTATPPAPSADLTAEAPEAVYRDAVADVVGRIAAGDLFQANIARAWGGTLKPEADPFDVFLRLASAGGAPFAAFWRMGERALVSNSPELFLAWDPAATRIEARPIKGTRPRDPDPTADASLAAELLASAKDRAENLMIVDLMRNDLARVCAPGSVAVEALFAIESHPTVHHLVSTVVGRPSPGVTAADLLEATFPPGSITGAPKHQAMKVIASHEPPRGPWCGSLFLLGPDGGLTASVLIRTASFERDAGIWRYRTLAGAGIVADSEPALELAETEVKISALRHALTGQQSAQPTVSTRRGRR